MAERKVFSLLRAQAIVRLVSPQLTKTLAEQVSRYSIEWSKRGYERGDLDGALLVFAATDKRDVQNIIVQDAQQAGVLINVVDAPELCDFQVPAVVQREKLNIAVSTNGASPALAAQIRQELEEKYGDEYAILLRLMSRLRGHICQDSSTEWVDRKILFQNILHRDIIQWIRDEQWELLSRHLEIVFGPGKYFDLSELVEKK